MGENITVPTAERTAERCTFSSVHHIRSHHAKVQRNRHLKKYLELINLWLVFRSSQIKLDHAIDCLFTSPLANAKVCWLTTERANPTSLDAHFVEPTLFWATLPEPAG